MKHQELLLRAALDDPILGRVISQPVIKDMIAALSPEIIRRFATIPALGGSVKRRPCLDITLPEDAIPYSEAALKRLRRRIAMRRWQRTS